MPYRIDTKVAGGDALPTAYIESISLNTGNCNPYSALLPVKTPIVLFIPPYPLVEVVDEHLFLSLLRAANLFRPLYYCLTP